VDMGVCSVVYNCQWKCDDVQYNTKSRNSEQISVCVRYSEQSMKIY
jgi:hypothetical protein